MNNELYEKVKKILVENLHIKDAEITPEKRLVNDLGINSLELADLVLSCEDVFGIEVEDNIIGKFVTVSDVVAYLEKKVSA